MNRLVFRGIAALSSLVVVASAALVSACGADAPHPGSPNASSSGGACAHAQPASCTRTPPAYTREVMPVLERHCLSCHSKDGVAADDHDFSKYAVASAQKSRISDQVASCAMPPKSRPPIPAADAQVLLDWAACGGLEK